MKTLWVAIQKVLTCLLFSDFEHFAFYYSFCVGPLDPEDEGSTTFRNILNVLPNDSL
jgi:hypothetical protein